MTKTKKGASPATTVRQVRQKQLSPNFGRALSEGFKAPWRHKVIWFYGVLLAVFAGGSTYSPSTYSSSGQNTADFQKVVDYFNSVPVSTWIAIGVVVAIVTIVFTILGLVIGSWSLAAIINGNAKIQKGEEVSRKEIGKTGKASVWGLIKLNFFIPMGIVLAVLALGALVVVLALALGNPVGTVFGVTVAVLAFLAPIPLLIYFGIVWIMAARSVVLEGKKAFESLGEARKMLKGNFWMTFALSLVAGLIVSTGGCLGSILFVIFLMFAVGFVVVGWLIPAAVMGILALAGLIVLVIVAGYFRAFQESTLTVWWLDLKNIQSK